MDEEIIWKASAYIGLILSIIIGILLFETLGWWAIICISIPYIIITFFLGIWMDN